MCFAVFLMTNDSEANTDLPEAAACAPLLTSAIAVTVSRSRRDPIRRAEPLGIEGSAAWVARKASQMRPFPAPASASPAAFERAPR